MDDGKIKLCAALKFDSKHEADAIRLTDSLRESHKIGEFLSELVRLALDNPEIIKYDKNTGTFSSGSKIGEHELIKYRTEFNKSITAQITEMRDKIDRAYNMSLNSYMAGMAGNTLGLYEKAENQLKLGFILERQLTEINDIIGGNVNCHYASNKIDDVRERAEEVVEYIIQNNRDMLTVNESSASSESAYNEKDEDKSSNNGNTDLAIVEALKELTKAVSELKVVGTVSNAVVEQHKETYIDAHVNNVEQSVSQNNAENVVKDTDENTNDTYIDLDVDTNTTSAVDSFSENADLSALAKLFGK